MTIERRLTKDIELRAQSTSTAKKLSGYVTKFGMLSQDLGGFREKVDRFAFENTIKHDDIRALFNHDANVVLGRTSAGTLKLTTDRTGLLAEITLPKTQPARDVWESVKRGDITQQSFSFTTIKDEYETVDGEQIRTLLEVKLHDTGPVVFPAYEQSQISARAKSNLKGAIVMDIPTLMQEKGTLVAEMRKINDQYTSGRAFSAEDETSYRKMEARLDEISQEFRKERLEHEAVALETGGTPASGMHLIDGPIGTAARQTQNPQFESRIFLPGQFKPEHVIQPGRNDKRDAEVFQRLVLRGIGGLTDGEKAVVNGWASRALQADVDTSGGYTVAPEVMAGKIIAELFNAVAIRRYSTVLVVNKAASLGAPVLDNDPVAAWATEITTSEDSTADFEKRSLTPHPLSTLLKVSEKLVRLSATDILGFLSARIGNVFGVTEEQSYLTGTGAGQPLGCLIDSPAGITNARDTTTTAAVSIKADDLIDCFYAIKAQYRRNARWMISRTALKEIRKVKDGQGNYVWRPGISSDRPDTILDKPFEESEYFPTAASGAYCAIVGDWSFYWICDELSMQLRILNELYAATAQVAIVARRTTDGMPVLETGFQRLKYL